MQKLSEDRIIKVLEKHTPQRSRFSMLRFGAPGKILFHGKNDSSRAEPSATREGLYGLPLPE